jgi:hypothetical protein
MTTSHNFCYKVTVSSKARQDASYCPPDKREDAFMALVRCLASNPALVFNLKDDGMLSFKDPKSDHVFFIQFHKINL